MRPRGGSPVSNSWSIAREYGRRRWPDRAAVACSLPSSSATTAELLQQLIRFNTVNPPGDERACQEYLAGILRDAGFEVELLGRTDGAPEPRRAAARRRRRPAARACSRHVDTVLAEPADWSATRGRARSRDGGVWGRGALDMKSQTAAEVTAAVSLAREGWRPARAS